MEKMDMKWVDRIFEVLECVYKERWRQLIGSEERKNLLKTMWSTGLSGLTASEVKRGLMACEFAYSAHPPTNIEFYHYAKGLVAPRRKSTTGEPHKGNAVVAKQYLDEIRQKMGKYAR